MASLLRSVSLGLRLGATKSCGELCRALSSFVLLKKKLFHYTGVTRTSPQFLARYCSKDAAAAKPEETKRKSWFL